MCSISLLVSEPDATGVEKTLRTTRTQVVGGRGSRREHIGRDRRNRGKREGIRMTERVRVKRVIDMRKKGVDDGRKQGTNNSTQHYHACACTVYMSTHSMSQDSLAVS